MSKFVKKISLFLAVALMVCSFSFPENDKVFAKTSRKDYGVFIGVTKLDYKKLGQYNQVVIDAEYFSKAQIKKLKKAGVKIKVQLGSKVIPWPGAPADSDYLCLPPSRSAYPLVPCFCCWVWRP